MCDNCELKNGGSSGQLRLSPKSLWLRQKHFKLVKMTRHESSHMDNIIANCFICGSGQHYIKPFGWSALDGLGLCPPCVEQWLLSISLDAACRMRLYFPIEVANIIGQLMFNLLVQDM